MRPRGLAVGLVGVVLVLSLQHAAASATRELAESRVNRARVSKIHSISEEGKAQDSARDDEQEKKVYNFSFAPLQGQAGGGTMVTFTLSHKFPENPSGNFWCKFGEKAVPSQSYYLSDNGRAFVCQTPAATPRQHLVKISMDGKAYYYGQSSQKFLYYT